MASSPFTPANPVCARQGFSMHETDGAGNRLNALGMAMSIFWFVACTA
jgi:hypothetical protein